MAKPKINSRFSNLMEIFRKLLIALALIVGLLLAGLAVYVAVIGLMTLTDRQLAGISVLWAVLFAPLLYISLIGCWLSKNHKKMFANISMVWFLWFSTSVFFVLLPEFLGK